MGIGIYIGLSHCIGLSVRYLTDNIGCLWDWFTIHILHRSKPPLFNRQYLLSMRLVYHILHRSEPPLFNRQYLLSMRLVYHILHRSEPPLFNRQYLLSMRLVYHILHRSEPPLFNRQYLLSTRLVDHILHTVGLSLCYLREHLLSMSGLTSWSHSTWITVEVNAETTDTMYLCWNERPSCKYFV